jgi:chromate transporter
MQAPHETLPDLPTPKPTSLGELAQLFTKLGFTAFGGPAAHIAMLEDEVVHRRQWMDRAHFLDLIAAVNFIPGPNSTELVLHIGQLRRGFPGLLVAGVCFIAPAMLIILPIAWAYVTWVDTIPQFEPTLRGIGIAVAAIVVFATLRFAQTSLRDSFTLFVAIIAILSHPLFSEKTSLQPEIVVLFFAALVGFCRQHLLLNNKSMLFAFVFTPEQMHHFLRMCWLLFKIGATLFGSGYVLIAYLKTGMVEQLGWLTDRQLVDAVAVGQFTPGPLLTTATFIGFLLGSKQFAGGTPGGIVGGIAATAAIFLPAFILIASLGKLLQRMRQSARARGALDAMNAAVVGIMIVTAAEMTSQVFRAPTSMERIIAPMFLLTCLLALWKGINATWLVMVGGIVGGVVQFTRH